MVFVGEYEAVRVDLGGYRPVPGEKRETDALADIDRALRFFFDDRYQCGAIVRSAMSHQQSGADTEPLCLRQRGQQAYRASPISQRGRGNRLQDLPLKRLFQQDA